MQFNDKIYVAGHNGLVGSAIIRQLVLQGYNNILSANSSQLDLRNQLAVQQFFELHKPKYVFLAAAKVGGILANSMYGADFIADNILIQTNVIQQAFVHKVKKLLFLGSSCIYPKMAEQPIKESYFMTGALEPTNAPYAIAKIAGIEMCKAYHAQYGCNYISAMPTNLYGQNDNYDLQNAHVLPALIRKFYEANKQQLPTVTVWGTGTPKREFLHADDAASACVFLMQHYNSPEIVNIGCGNDYSIAELAEAVKEVIEFKGEIIYDTSKPDGTKQKLLDVHKINSLGWFSSISLQSGLTKTVKNFIENYSHYTSKKQKLGIDSNV